MSVPALIAAAVSALSALAVPWPAIIDARSRTKARKQMRKRADALWELGDREGSVALTAWVLDPEHPPPEISPRLTGSLERDRSIPLPRRIESRQRS